MDANLANLSPASRWRRKHPDKYAEDKKRRVKAAKERYWSDPEYREKVISDSSKRYHRLRDEMFDAYGSECACCGESCRPFLTLEHLSDDGRGFRGGKKTGGTSELTRLKKLGWPKDLATVMCMNCNHARGRFGKCPHRIDFSKY